MRSPLSGRILNARYARAPWRGLASRRGRRQALRSILEAALPIASSVKPWQRIVGARPNGGGGSPPGLPPDPGGDSRGAFGDLRLSLESELQREPGSPLLVRASFERLVGAFVAHAQQSRGAVGLVAFELEGRPVEEIASSAGCAVNTVWTRIHRARSQLKQLVLEGST